MTKPRKILVPLNHYLPGFKSGGVLRTVANVVDRLGKQFEFWIITRDRDAKDGSPYPNVVLDRWTTVGNAKVLYTNRISPLLLLRQVKAVNPDMIWLNSFFAPFSIALLLGRKMRLVKVKHFAIAPRGELMDSALAIKRRRKTVFMLLARFLGLHKGLTWHASAETEETSIKQQIGSAESVVIIPDIPKTIAPIAISPSCKRTGEVRFVFISRICITKNLDFFLRCLVTLRGNVIVDIFGPIESDSYWSTCNKIMQEMPANVSVRYRGAIANDDVLHTLSKYHFFVLPTRGENFCHAIVESLSAGVPVITSADTPWHDLSSFSAGWALPLSNRESWNSILQQCVEMNAHVYHQMTTAAFQYIYNWSQRKDIIQKTESALGL